MVENLAERLCILTWGIERENDHGDMVENLAESGNVCGKKTTILGCNMVNGLRRFRPLPARRNMSSGKA